MAHNPEHERDQPPASAAQEQRSSPRDPEEREKPDNGVRQGTAPGSQTQQNTRSTVDPRPSKPR